MARPKQIAQETVYEIRRLYAEGSQTQTELAKSFGLSQSTICKIVNNYIHKTTANLIMGGEAEVRVGYRHGD